MGNATTRDSECQVLAVTGASRQQAIKDLLSVALDKDLYELFELERYACRDDSGRFEQQIKAKFREFALQYHPDKNSLMDDETKAENAKVLVYVTNGKDILLDPDAKQRYDIELRRARNEESDWDSVRCWSRWMSNASLVLVGSFGLVVGGVAVGAATGGSALALSIAGSSMLSAGIRGAIAHHQDPHATNYDYSKQICIGALAGGIGGACTAAVQVATIAAQVGIAAAGGAGSALANHMIEDAANVLDGTQSVRDLMTAEHLATVGTSVVMGACGGMAIQAVACGLQGCAPQSQRIIDDAALVAKNAAAGCAISTVVSTVTSLAEQCVEHQKALSQMAHVNQLKHRIDNGHVTDRLQVAPEARGGLDVQTGKQKELFEIIFEALGMTMTSSFHA
eukprot:TRINITY_DN19309_c0_g5_i2.p1 TRINITY_DN19309_c0_g5~~TRINITY_DN19309_c0_g5_i2.p1  ORF type:complete len:395 (+),score=49.51 TRINITY_DN19309_c0_g5_i2:128-1312(+)